MLTPENIHEYTRSSILAADATLFMTCEKNHTRVYFPRVIFFYAYDTIPIPTYAGESRDLI